MPIELSFLATPVLGSITFSGFGIASAKYGNLYIDCGKSNQFTKIQCILQIV